MLVCYCDGGCNNKTRSNAYGSFVVRTPSDDGMTELHRQRIEFDNCSTSNEAEYEILICLLEFLLEKQYNTYHIEIHSDSKLMVNQVNGGWRLEAENLKERRLMAVDFMTVLVNVTLTWVSRKVIGPILGH